MLEVALDTGTELVPLVLSQDGKTVTATTTTNVVAFSPTSEDAGA